jgi:hypothetical protein
MVMCSQDAGESRDWAAYLPAWTAWNMVHVQSVPEPDPFALALLDSACDVRPPSPARHPGVIPDRNPK